MITAKLDAPAWGPGEESEMAQSKAEMRATPASKLDVSAAEVGLAMSFGVLLQALNARLPGLADDVVQRLGDLREATLEDPSEWWGGVETARVIANAQLYARP